MVIKKENGNARLLAVGMLFVLAFFFTINPLVRTSLSVFLFFLVIVITIYSLREYQGVLTGITSKRLFKSLLIAGSISIGFYLIVSIFPGFSIGLPITPQAISDQLKMFIIVFTAPIVEELAFRGAMIGYLKKLLGEKRAWTIIFVQGAIFSLFHLGAYIGGLYSLPGFTEVLTSFNANISAFVSAFLFGTLAGYVTLKTNNLIPSIVMHTAINFIIYSSLSIII